MARRYHEIAMTPAVQEAQRHYYGRAQTFPTVGEGERAPLGPDEIEFISLRDSFCMATVGESGWPYVQHRGGPIGFLRVRDAETLAFDDYLGNRQLLSTGNLIGGDGRVALFLMDYPKRTRLKIMGYARVLDAENEPELAEELLPEERLRPKVERVFVIDVVLTTGTARSTSHLATRSGRLKPRSSRRSAPESRNWRRNWASCRNRCPNSSQPNLMKTPFYPQAAQTGSAVRPRNTSRKTAGTSSPQCDVPRARPN